MQTTKNRLDFLSDDRLAIAATPLPLFPSLFLSPPPPDAFSDRFRSVHVDFLLAGSTVKVRSSSSGGQLPWILSRGVSVPSFLTGSGVPKTLSVARLSFPLWRPYSGILSRWCQTPLKAVTRRASILSHLFLLFPGYYRMEPKIHLMSD